MGDTGSGGSKHHLVDGVGLRFARAIGPARFAGGKRSAGLQALAIGVSLASFAVATYLVNRTFINAALARQGDAFRVAVVPQNAALFFKVVSTNFGLMDLVFGAILVYEAWKIPRPLVLPARSAGTA